MKSKVIGRIDINKHEERLMKAEELAKKQYYQHRAEQPLRTTIGALLAAKGQAKWRAAK